MSEMENNKINEEQLDNVAGGNDGRGEGTYSAYDISPRWIRVTIGPMVRSPRSIREATGSKSMESPLTANGTDSGCMIRRAASATATFLKPTQN